MALRCFVAVPLTPGLRNEISSFVDDLRKTKADVKWVPAENLHITLKFLGNTEPELIPEIEKRLLGIAAVQSPFTLSLSGTGLFPDRKRPRVVWIDIGKSQELKLLHENLEDNLVTFGYNKDNRNFSPHLTVGRVRSSRNLAALLRGLETQRDRDFGKIEVVSFCLMKSDLKPGGAEYTAIAQINLKKEEK